MFVPQVPIVTRSMSGERGNVEDKYEGGGTETGDQGEVERKQFGQCQPFHLPLT